MSEGTKQYRVLKAVAIDGIALPGAIVELAEAVAANIGIGEYLEEVTAEAGADSEESPAATDSGAGEPTKPEGEAGEQAGAEGSEAKPEGEAKTPDENGSVPAGEDSENKGQ